MPDPQVIPPSDQNIIPEIAADAGGKAINELGKQLEGNIKSKFRSIMEGTPSKEGQAGEPSSPPTTPPASPAPAASTPPTAPEIPATDRPPEGLSKTGKEHWERFRALSQERIDTERKEKEALKKEYEAFKAQAKPSAPPDYEQVKARAQELEQHLERVALAESPRFKNYYEGGIAKQLKLVEGLGAHGKEAAKLLMEPDSEARDKRLSELQTEMGFKGHILSNAAATILQLQSERETELANWKTNFAALKAKESEEATAKAAKDLMHRQNAASLILNSARALPEFTPAPNDAAHATFAKEALDFISEALTGKLPESDALRLPVAAMKGQYLEEFVIPKLRAEVKALEERLSAFNRSTPQPHGQQRKDASLTQDPLHSDDPMVQIEAIKRKYADAMAGAV